MITVLSQTKCGGQNEHQLCKRKKDNNNNFSIVTMCHTCFFAVIHTCNSNYLVRKANFETAKDIFNSWLWHFSAFIVRACAEIIILNKLFYLPKQIPAQNIYALINWFFFVFFCLMFWLFAVFHLANWQKATCQCSHIETVFRFLLSVVNFVRTSLFRLKWSFFF